MDKKLNKKTIIWFLGGLIICILIINNYIANDSSVLHSKTGDNLKNIDSSTKKSTMKIMKDTKYETEVYIIDGKEPGPTIFINGGIHGDETAGFSAAERLLSYELKKGKLIILPRANKIATEMDKRTADFMEDLNRQFPGKKDGNDTEKIAWEITELIKDFQPDIVLDLHESLDNYRNGRLGNSIIFNPIIDSTADLVLIIVEDINSTVKEEDNFTFFTNPPQGSINNEISTLLNIPVLTIETNRKIDLEVRVTQQLDIVKRVFDNFGVE